MTTLQDSLDNSLRLFPDDIDYDAEIKKMPEIYRDHLELAKDFSALAELHQRNLEILRVYSDVMSNRREYLAQISFEEIDDEWGDDPLAHLQRAMARACCDDDKFEIERRYARWEEALHRAYIDVLHKALHPRHYS